MVPGAYGYIHYGTCFFHDSLNEFSQTVPAAGKKEKEEGKGLVPYLAKNCMHQEHARTDDCA